VPNYPKWSEEELILICDAMMNIGWKQIRQNSALAIELSNLLQHRAEYLLPEVGPRFRSVGSISRKSEDIRTVLPDHSGGKTRGGKLDAAVLERFLESPVKMHWEAENIRERYAPAEIEPAAAHPPKNMDISFPPARAPWGKVDTTLWREIGTAGELAIVNLLESAAPDLSVDHVAATRDGLGYDIAVSGRSEAHLEVKSTTVEGQLTIFLSRNEYHAMHRDPDWQLVAVRLSRTARLPTAVATVPNNWISENVPTDRSLLGRWESCRLDVPPDVPIPGISLLDISSGPDTASRLLSGAEAWMM
jgi:hypothetical protein